MKAFNNIKAAANGLSVKAGVVTLLALLCALSASTSPVQAQEEGAGPHHEYAGKHGRFGYRKPDHSHPC